MAKTVRKGNATWVKGKSGNPNGRPKGKYNENTIAFMSLKTLAAKNAHKAFDLLWRAMEANEGWAHQIYFRELYALPRDYDDKKVQIEDKTTDIDGQIKVLTDILPEFDEVTHHDSLNRLKVLTTIKTNEQIVDQVSQIRDSREDLLAKVDKVSKVIEHLENEDKENNKEQ
jgi:hypothetical protein